MYICNYTALDLGLEGVPDPSWEVVNLAAQARMYPGYICPEYDYTIPPQQAQTVPPHHDPAAAAAPDAAATSDPAAAVQKGNKPAGAGDGPASASVKQSRKR